MKLFQHQEKALELTKDRNKVAYYIDMGGGKTFIGSEKMMKLGKTFNLVVCQKSKIQDWIDHFHQYYNQFPYFTEVFDLTDKKQFEIFMKVVDEWEEYFEVWDDDREQTYLQENPDPCQYIGVINYDLVFRRPDLLHLEKFTLMLDESSIIQNEKAKRSKFILKMHPQNVILLSGTPTSGKYENLWTQIHLLGWNISMKVFQRQYVNWKKIDVGGVEISVVDKDDPYKNVDRLKSKLADNGAVFMKTEEFGIDLPEQTFIDIKVDSSKEYRKFKKDRFVKLQRDWLVENTCNPNDAGEVELAGDTTLTQMLYERQLCGQYSEEKWQALEDLIESTQDRLVIFYNFDAELMLLKELAENLERPVSEVNGHCKDLDAYENQSNSITLIQYQAGSMGLNLQKANKIVYFTLPLMSELFEQSKKRIHRIGQKEHCFYYTMTVRNSIEENIKQVLEMRKDYTNELFEKTD